MSDKPKEAETMDAQKWVDDVEKWRAALAQPQNDAEAFGWIADNEKWRGAIFYCKAEAEYRARLFGGEVRAVYTAPPSPERMREALEKLRSYNVDIDAGRINYRPKDHIAVIDAALSRAGDNHASDGKESDPIEKHLIDRNRQDTIRRALEREDR